MISNIATDIFVILSLYCGHSSLCPHFCPRKQRRRGKKPQRASRLNLSQGGVQKIFFAARRIVSISASVWALDRNMASNWLGAA